MGHGREQASHQVVGLRRRHGAGLQRRLERRRRRQRLPQLLELRRRQVRAGLELHPRRQRRRCCWWRRGCWRDWVAETQQIAHRVRQRRPYAHRSCEHRERVAQISARYWHVDGDTEAGPDEKFAIPPAGQVFAPVLFPLATAGDTSRSASACSLSLSRLASGSAAGLVTFGPSPSAAAAADPWALAGVPSAAPTPTANSSSSSATLSSACSQVFERCSDVFEGAFRAGLQQMTAHAATLRRNSGGQRTPNH